MTNVYMRILTNLFIVDCFSVTIFLKALLVAVGILINPLSCSITVMSENAWSPPFRLATSYSAYKNTVTDYHTWRHMTLVVGKSHTSVWYFTMNHSTSFDNQCFVWDHGTSFGTYTCSAIYVYGKMGDSDLPLSWKVHHTHVQNSMHVISLVTLPRTLNAKLTWSCWVLKNGNAKFGKEYS